MDYRNAENYYYFSEEFFKDHFSKLANRCELYYIEKDGKFISAAIFLKDVEYVHYHFSATDREYSKLQPMDLLIIKAIYDYGNEGYKYMHLGGGLTLEGSDGLSKFKKKYSDLEREFYISKIICDEEEYYKNREKYGISNSPIFLIKDAIK